MYYEKNCRVQKYDNNLNVQIFWTNLHKTLNKKKKDKKVA